MRCQSEVAGRRRASITFRGARRVFLAVAAMPSVALAGASFTSGTILFTHDPDLGSGTPANLGLVLGTLPSSASLPVSPTFQFSHTGVDLSSSSIAKGSIGFVTNSTTATVTLAGGTGVTQSDPGNNFNLGSSLRMDLGNLVYTVTSPGYGPTATGYFSVTTAGSVGAGGSVNFSATINYLDHITGLPLRAPASFNQTITTAGAFTRTFTSCLAFAPSTLATGRKIRLTGFIEFRAINDVTPTLLEPLAVDVGGAPPTAEFVGTDGNWNDPTNWTSDIISGDVPNHTGDRAYFAPTSDAAVNRIVTLTTPVELGTLSFFDVFGGSLTIAGAQPLVLSVDSDHAVMEQRSARGGGSVNVATPVSLLDPLDVIVETPDSITISGNISGTNTPITKSGPGKLTLSGTNTFTGGINVVEGSLVIANPDALGVGTAGLTLSGGNVSFTSANTTTLGSQIRAQSAKPANISSTGTLNLNASLTGGQFRFDVAANRARILATSPVTGPLELARGTLELGGNGALPNVPAVLNSGMIELNNAPTAIGNRINDAATIISRGASLTLIGANGFNINETVGPIVLDGGLNVFTITAPAGTQTRLIAQTLQRQNGGVAFVRGTNLGTLGASTAARLLLNAPPPLLGGGGGPGSQSISILPAMYGSASNVAAPGTTLNSLVTYDPISGVRPLDLNTEYAGNLPLPGQPVNVRLTSINDLIAPTQINALVLGPNGSIQGAGHTLTIQSGMILNTGVNNTVDCDINFGPAEGVLITGQPIILTGKISGTGGLTKAGLSDATLTGASTYTGQTTITGGTVNFNGDVIPGVPGPLGIDSSPIILSAGNDVAVRLYALAPATTTFNRDLIVHGNSNGTTGFGNLGVTGQTVIMNGAISLDSQLTIEGDPGALIVFNGVIGGPGSLTDDFASIQTLNAANTYTGGTIIRDGIYRVANNQALGTGSVTFGSTNTTPTGAIQAGGGGRFGTPTTIENPIFLEADPTVSGSAPIIFNGPIDLGGALTHNITNTADTEYAGGLTGGGFTKAGAGRLILSGYSNYNGLTTVSAGELVVRNIKALGSPVAATVVQTGAKVRLDTDGRTVEPITISGAGADGLGVLQSTGVFTSVATLTIAADSVVQVDAGSRFDVLNLADFGAALNVGGAGTMTVDRIRGAALNVSGTTVFQIRNDPAGTSISRLDTESTAPAAAIDLTRNALILNYTGASPLTTIRSQIISGFNAGAWNGTGIRSSTAATELGRAIGFAEATALGSPPTFLGEPIDATTILLRYTLTGDADLSGSVNLDDFTRLAAGFGSIGSTWTSGDFNYDGVTTLDDFTALAANFGSSLGSDLPRGVAVPEPVLSSSAFLLLVSLARRSKR